MSALNLPFALLTSELELCAISSYEDSHECYTALVSVIEKDFKPLIHKHLL